MRAPFTLLATLLLLACPLIGNGQSKKAIVGATLIDGTGRAPIKDAVVVIDGTRISQVGTRDKVNIEKGTTVINASGKFIIPGLADMHNHLGEGTFDLNQRQADYTKNLSRLLGWGFTRVYNFGLPAVDPFAELKRVSAAEASRYPHFLALGFCSEPVKGTDRFRGA
ncbi:MAG TPA: hypothetical protein VMM84_05385 [Pyrinomonadaceae bacterium]|nr:hypothetical protein [Pyrinomonadaceae bacterium]